MSDLPEQSAVKVVSVQAGSLRQRVKKHELHPSDVLEWLKTQEQVSPEFVAWLKSKAATWSATPPKKEEPKVAKVEQAEAKKPRQKRSRGPRQGNA